MRDSGIAGPTLRLALPLSGTASRDTGPTVRETRISKPGYGDPAPAAPDLCLRHRLAGPLETLPDQLEKLPVDAPTLRPYT